MDYVELTAAVPTADVERACDVLRQVVAGGVWVDQPFTQPDLESDAELSTRGTALVHGYAAEQVDAQALPLRARAAFAHAGIAVELAQRVVAEEDWAEAWKEYFYPERFGEHIVIVPTWREFDPVPGDVVIALDPGMAFGTGQHETTRMCLEAIEQHMWPGMTVLDAGSGSGILSLAAAKLGAAAVYAVDVDPNCARVTGDNARLNNVESIVHAREGSLGDAWPFDEPAAGGFDVVVANIIARVIVEHAASLAGALRDGGRLIVSGVIGEREAEVVGALTAAGVRVESVRAMGDWRCIVATRP